LFCHTLIKTIISYISPKQTGWTGDDPATSTL